MDDATEGVSLAELERAPGTRLPRPRHVGEQSQPGEEHIGRLLDWARLTGVARYATVRLTGGWLVPAGPYVIAAPPGLHIDMLSRPADQRSDLGGWTLEVTGAGGEPVTVDLTVEGLVYCRGTRHEQDQRRRMSQAAQQDEARRLRAQSGHGATDALWSTTRAREVALKQLAAAEEAQCVAVRAAVTEGVSWVEITRATRLTHDQVRAMVAETD